MALKNCKECEHKISTKAETCPSCGAKQPKATSRATWLVLILVGAIVFSAMSTQEKRPQASNVESNVTVKEDSVKTVTTTSKAKEELKIQRPEWRTFNSTDEMTGDTSHYAISPSALSTRPMSFPYTGVTSSLAVGCSASSSWAYLVFSESPNITNDETEDGYNLIPTRVKWDSELVKMTLTQDWGSKFLHFMDDANTIKKIQASNEVLLEFSWHGQDQVYFKISLNGSSNAIKEILNKCKP